MESWNEERVKKEGNKMVRECEVNIGGREVEGAGQIG